MSLDMECFSMPSIAVCISVSRTERPPHASMALLAACTVLMIAADGVEEAVAAWGEIFSFDLSDMSVLSGIVQREVDDTGAYHHHPPPSRGAVVASTMRHLVSSTEVAPPR